MKNLSFIFLFVFGTGLFSKAQTTTGGKDSIATKDNPNAAEITFEKDLHDYGTIKNGSDGTCEFKFKNTGKEPLVISNARGSCGCTVPTWPKEPIMKGQTAVVKVHYDTKRPGAFTKTVTIESNAKTNSKVLTIKGLVETAEENNAEQTMPFRKIQDGATPLENKLK
ncbi:MAG: DUF1573 domain-containing protein [Bacteroidetes bacterium]|nr:DUF1573 domain-containing protein [Bacteroidota bacterium]